MSKIFLSFLGLVTFTNGLFSQTILTADGPGNTYELITNILAPGYNPIESPDCSHIGFGRHIEEVWDADLGKNVFVFHIHVSNDDDRCINIDRQRNEIKTYDQSADSLKATAGETVIYKWKFKLDVGFQPSSSFTHLHQIKAVGGTESSMPLITLTARAGTPEKLELRYAESISQITVANTNLSDFKGVWVEVTETITYGESGIYDLSIVKISDGSTLFSYSNPSIRMWKTDASFLRPKWGIYRSLNNSIQLRDETVLFADFYIKESSVELPITLSAFDLKEDVCHTNIYWTTETEENAAHFILEKSHDGRTFNSIAKIQASGNSSSSLHYQFKDTDVGKASYYRLKNVDMDGSFNYSDLIYSNGHTCNKDLAIHSLYPNPVKAHLTISMQLAQKTKVSIEIVDVLGKVVLTQMKDLSEGTNTLDLDMSTLNEGIYFMKIQAEGDQFPIYKEVIKIK